MEKKLTALIMCMLLVGTVATTAAVDAAPQGGQAGKSPIISFDAAGPDGAHCKIMINTNTGRFSLNYHGFKPLTKFKLVFHVDGLLGARLIKEGRADKDGYTYLEGILDQDFLRDVLPHGGHFSLE
jgi:hypothetical protein